MASPAFVRPGGWVGLVAFFLQGAVVGSAAALLTSRATRRALPLASLLNMTLVFPDHAPSRFSVALRSRTLGQLKKQLASGQIDWPTDDQQAAEMLVAMVTQLGRHERLTRGHTERVRAYADLIAQEMGLPPKDRELLHWAAMVHDIGKLTVPPEILNKAGRPTDAEWAVLKGHPEAGGKMLEPLRHWLGEWRLAASQHHERWDGTGYPYGLAGRDISLAGRIVAVADAYDVITSKRSYKEATPAETARQELVRCAGTQFDPDVVRALLRASLGRDRTAFGFLGWLAELNVVASLTRAATQATTSMVTATAVTAGAVAAIPLVAEELNDRTEQIVTAAPPVELPMASRAGSLDEPVDRAVEPGPTSIEPPAAEPEELTSTTTTTVPSSTSEPTTVLTTLAPSTAAPTSTAAPAPTTTEPPPPTDPPPTSTTAPPTSESTTIPPPVGPTAVDDAFTVENAWPILLFVLANDDPGSSDFDESTLEALDGPHNEYLFWIFNGRMRYGSNTPGTDSITYQICNTDGLCDIGVVTITVLDNGGGGGGGGDDDDDD